MIELVACNERETVQAIVKLEAEAFGNGGMNEWHLVPLIRHGRVFVARVNGVIAGSVQYLLDWEQRDKAYMFGVALSSVYRGKGVGTEFLKQSFQRLAGEGIKEIELTVDANNIAAVKVYETKLGFHRADFRKNEYGDGEDRLVMILSIDNR